MTEREFVFWLRGYICHPDVTILNEGQVVLIKEYLKRLAQGECRD